MLVFPNAKINIGLYVTEKRNDGYHDLETIFFPVAAQDVLEIIDHSGQLTDIHITGLPVAGEKDQNLAWKAYTLFKNEFPDRVGQLSIHLHKHIAMGAGMGGGSADGAFMLRLMNDHFSLGLSQDQLESFALQLGSDCPFFIRNKSCFAVGRGELMEPVALPDLSPYDLQIICPEVHVSTAEAFKGMIPKPAPFNLKNIASLPFKDWKDHVGNDFESTVFVRHPELAAIKQQVYEQGAIYASMTGTGSAIYAFFEKGNKAVVKTGLRFNEYLV